MILSGDGGSLAELGDECICLTTRGKPIKAKTVGQKQYVDLITQNTIEEKIRLLQQQKAELFAGLIGNDASSTKQLTEEDIQFILS